MTIATDLVAIKEQIEGHAEALDTFVNGPASGSGSTYTNSLGIVVKSLARIQAEVLAAGTVNLGANNVFTGKNQFTGGSDSISGGKNASGQIVASYWPDGDRTAEVGARFGVQQTGFVGNNLYVNGMQWAWLNDALSLVNSQWDAGSLANVIGGYPGSLNVNPAWRWQNYDNSGDFRTDARLSMVVTSATSFLFNADAASGNDTFTNLTFIPTSNSYITDAIAAADLIGADRPAVRLHSNSGLGIAGDAVIASIAADKIVMDQAATEDLSDVLFSIVITAPAANYEGGTPFLSYTYIPFTGTIEDGSTEITDLKFDPTHIGIPTYATASGTGIPALSRIINFTDDAIQIGDATTGQPVNGTADGTGVTITINTTTESFTCTGDVSDDSSWITNLSVDPTARAIPTDGTASWDRPQFEGETGVFEAGTYVIGVTGLPTPSIQWSSNALQTLTQTNGKVGMARVAIRHEIMARGRLERFMTQGWSPALGLPATRFENFDIYAGLTKIIDLATAEYVGRVSTDRITATSWYDIKPAAAPAAPSTSGAWRIYVDSGDGNKLKAKASNGTVETLGTP